jgi:hypothetical protein
MNKSRGEIHLTYIRRWTNSMDKNGSVIRKDKSFLSLLGESARLELHALPPREPEFWRIYRWL